MSALTFYLEGVALEKREKRRERRRELQETGSPPLSLVVRGAAARARVT